MYFVQKTFEISAAHKLNLDYESKCQNLHGHNWLVTVFCKASQLDNNGMVVDFTHIKRAVHNVLDHQCLNDVMKDNPTAENIARWIAEKVGPKCYRVTVQESGGNVAAYEADE